MNRDCEQRHRHRAWVLCVKALICLDSLWSCDHGTCQNVLLHVASVRLEGAYRNAVAGCNPGSAAVCAPGCHTAAHTGSKSKHAVWTPCRWVSAGAHSSHGAPHPPQPARCCVKLLAPPPQPHHHWCHWYRLHLQRVSCGQGQAAHLACLVCTPSDASRKPRVCISEHQQKHKSSRRPCEQAKPGPTIACVASRLR